MAEDGTDVNGLYNVNPDVKKLIGKSRRRSLIGPLRKGKLTSLGYSATAKAKTRRVAIDKAVKRYGKLSTLRKLNAVAVYTKRTSPIRSKTYKADVKYVQKKYY